MSDINSREYWDTRFRTDWVDRYGREQSRFFAHVALRLIPDWLRRELVGATVCDWGCALGDGTAALAQALPEADWTGIDFAASAIEQARRGFPAVAFDCRDLLREPGDGGFDAIFSSNVLEHFTEPMAVFALLGAHARRFQIHLVPFREDRNRREPEHEVVFDWADLRFKPSTDWQLVHASTIDASNLAGSLWSGEQALLAFARTDIVDDLGLDLIQTRIDCATSDAAIRTLTTANERIGANLANAIAETAALQRANAALQSALRDKDLDLARVTAELSAARGDLQQIKASRTWRWTSFLRR